MIQTFEDLIRAEVGTLFRILPSKEVLVVTRRNPLYCRPFWEFEESPGPPALHTYNHPVEILGFDEVLLAMGQLMITPQYIHEH